MLDPERHPSGEAETEVALLRARLADVIRTNDTKLAVRMPDNLDAPTNVVLAGTYQATSEVQAREKIRIWHRFFNNEKDYLIVMHSGSDVHWVHITDSQAHWVWHNRPPLTKDDILKIEWRIQSDIVEWDMKAAEQAASDDNDIFDSLNYWQ